MIIMAKRNDDNQLFDLFNFTKLFNNDEDNDEELESEMNDLNLEEWQKDLVREGKYSPYDFEEEELEEDDYYSEDD